MGPSLSDGPTFFFPSDVSVFLELTMADRTERTMHLARCTFVYLVARVRRGHKGEGTEKSLALCLSMLHGCMHHGNLLELRSSKEWRAGVAIEKLYQFQTSLVTKRDDSKAHESSLDGQTSLTR